jgi:hypothetical protein
MESISDSAAKEKGVCIGLTAAVQAPTERGGWKNDDYRNR